MLDITGGFSVSVADAVPLKFPTIVTFVTAPTALLVTSNVAVAEPSATVTLAGTTAARLSEDNATTAPPEPAALFSVTVPVDELPPVIAEGFSVTEERAGRFTARPAVLVTPFSEAEMFALTSVPTAIVVIVNVAVLDPAATVT
jgi:hypothetical protein